MRKLRISHVEFRRGQIGWSCRMGFMMPCASQCTDIMRAAEGVGVGRFALLRSAVEAYRAARAEWSGLPGVMLQRARKGWV